MSSTSNNPTKQAMIRGFLQRCPNCGKGHLFRAYLKQVDSCADCGEPFGHIRADDGPAWLTILITGHVVVGVALAVEMIAPLSAEQLALPAAAHQWTIGMLAQHLIANRAWWFQMWMGEGSPDLAPIAHWDPAADVEQPPLGAAELVVGLERTWRMIADALARWTSSGLARG